MEKSLTVQKPAKLPTVADLYDDSELTVKNTALAVLLNADPKKDWIKKNPFANNTDYIPISIQEWLMTRIFGKWRVEIKTVNQLLNSVCVTIRLHFIDPVTGQWDWMDGVGAQPIQMDAGAGNDITKIKSGAIQISAPAAESYAFKDACEKLGRIFGKDLNRKWSMDYSQLGQQAADRFNIGKTNEDKERTRIYEHIESIDNLDDLDLFAAVSPGYEDVIEKRRRELKG